MNLTHILKRPIITEKSIQDASNGVFTFEVSRDANKDQVKHIIEAVYGVSVVDVRTTTSAGKRYRVGRQRQEKVGLKTKKARVQLKPGQKIDLFELEEAN